MAYVYVIPIKKVPFVNGETFDGVYVGSTSKDPKIRFEQHKGRKDFQKKKGKSGSRVVKLFGPESDPEETYKVPKNIKKEEYEQNIANNYVEKEYYVWSGADAYRNHYECKKCKKTIYLGITQKKAHVVWKCTNEDDPCTSDDVDEIKKLLKSKRGIKRGSI